MFWQILSLTAAAQTQHSTFSHGQKRIGAKVKLAEQAEWYDDRAACLKAVTEQGAELSNEERDLL
jgi:hypothetical protein